MGCFAKGITRLQELEGMHRVPRGLEPTAYACGSGVYVRGPGDDRYTRLANGATQLLTRPTISHYTEAKALRMLPHR